MIAIVHIDPHFGGSRFWIKHWINKGNSPLKSLAGKCLGRKGNRLPIMQPLQVRLIGIQLNPDRAQICNSEYSTAGFNVHTFLGILVNHDSTGRGIDRHVLRRLTGLFNRLNLLRG